MKKKLIVFGMAVAMVTFFSCNVDELEHPTEISTPEKTETTISNKDFNDLSALAQFLDEEELSEIKSKLAWIDAPATRAGFEDITDIQWGGEIQNIISWKGSENFDLTIFGTYGSIEVKAVWGPERDGVSLWDCPDDTGYWTDINIEAFYAPFPTYRVITWYLRADNDGEFMPFAVMYQDPAVPSMTHNLASTYNYMIPQAGATVRVSRSTGAALPQLGKADKFLFRVIDEDDNIIHESVPAEPVMDYSLPAAIQIKEMPNGMTDHRNFTIKYFYQPDPSDADNKSILEYFSDSNFDWYELTSGVQRFNVDQIVINNLDVKFSGEVMPNGNEVTFTMMRGEESVFQFEDVEFRIRPNIHRYYTDETTWNTEHTHAGFYGVTYPGAADRDGYVTIEFPAVAEPDGWVHNIVANNIAYHYTFGAAQWIVEYKSNNSWVELTKRYQRAYYLYVAHADKQIVAASGGTYQINVGGFFDIDEVQFRAVDGNGNVISEAGVTYKSNEVSNSASATGRVYMNILPNTSGAPRQIFVEYTIDDAGTWAVWNSSNPLTSQWSMTGKNTPYPLTQDNQ